MSKIQLERFIRNLVSREKELEKLKKTFGPKINFRLKKILILRKDVKNLRKNIKINIVREPQKDLLGDFFKNEKVRVRERIPRERVKIKYPSSSRLFPFFDRRVPTRTTRRGDLIEPISRRVTPTRIQREFNLIEPISRRATPTRTTRRGRVTEPVSRRVVPSRRVTKTNLVIPRIKPFETPFYEFDFKIRKTKKKKVKKKIIKKGRKYVAQITAFESSLGLGPRYVEAGKKFTGFEVTRGRVTKTKKSKVIKRKRDDFSKLLY